MKDSPVVSNHSSTHSGHHSTAPTVLAKFDISVALEDFVFENSRLLQLYTNIQRPLFGQLTILVKRYFKHATLCDAHAGFLSSYSHQLLLIHFLQRKRYLPYLQDPDLYARWETDRAGDVRSCSSNTINKNDHSSQVQTAAGSAGTSAAAPCSASSVPPTPSGGSMSIVSAAGCANTLGNGMNSSCSSSSTMLSTTAGLSVSPNATSSRRSVVLAEQNPRSLMERMRLDWVRESRFVDWAEWLPNQTTPVKYFHLTSPRGENLIYDLFYEFLRYLAKFNPHKHMVSIRRKHMNADCTWEKHIEVLVDPDSSCCTSAGLDHQHAGEAGANRSSSSTGSVEMPAAAGESRKESVESSIHQNDGTTLNDSSAEPQDEGICDPLPKNGEAGHATSCSHLIGDTSDSAVFPPSSMQGFQLPAYELEVGSSSVEQPAKMKLGSCTATTASPDSLEVGSPEHDHSNLCSPKEQVEVETGVNACSAATSCSSNTTGGEEGGSNTTTVGEESGSSTATCSSQRPGGKSVGPTTDGTTTTTNTAIASSSSISTNKQAISAQPQPPKKRSRATVTQWLVSEEKSNFLFRIEDPIEPGRVLGMREEKHQAWVARIHFDLEEWEKKPEYICSMLNVSTPSHSRVKRAVEQARRRQQEQHLREKAEERKRRAKEIEQDNRARREADLALENMLKNPEEWPEVASSSLVQTNANPSASSSSSANNSTTAAAGAKAAVCGAGGVANSTNSSANNNNWNTPSPGAGQQHQRTNAVSQGSWSGPENSSEPATAGLEGPSTFASNSASRSGMSFTDPSTSCGFAAGSPGSRPAGDSSAEGMGSTPSMSNATTSLSLYFNPADGTLRARSTLRAPAHYQGEDHGMSSAVERRGTAHQQTEYGEAPSSGDNRRSSSSSLSSRFDAQQHEQFTQTRACSSDAERLKNSVKKDNSSRGPPIADVVEEPFCFWGVPSGGGVSSLARSLETQRTQHGGSSRFNNGGSRFEQAQHGQAQGGEDGGVAGVPKRTRSRFDTAMGNPAVPDSTAPDSSTAVSATAAHSSMSMVVPKRARAGTAVSVASDNKSGANGKKQKRKKGKDVTTEMLRAWTGAK
ncbi:unnamed protein product [Amoebophrya sp. A25]|nr:unnamed protein product [Amoebophrya sp. A25]|eukprot:GSA25T00019570001.1